MRRQNADSKTGLADARGHVDADNTNFRCMLSARRWETAWRPDQFSMKLMSNVLGMRLAKGYF